MAQKARIEEYADGNVTIYNLRNNLGVPVFGLNEMISASRVTQYWDGTPMNESKVDNQLYLQLKELPDDTNTDLEKYIGNYFKVNLPNEGELFLERDTMAEMRGLNSTEILLLQMGYYKGVRLNGYHAKGDTPVPIEYTLSSTSESDDGGSVIEVGTIKLEHDFNGKSHIKYFGVKNGEDSTVFLKKYIEYCLKYEDVFFGFDNTSILFSTDGLQDVNIINKRSVIFSCEGTTLENIKIHAENEETNLFIIDYCNVLTTTSTIKVIGDRESSGRDDRRGWFFLTIRATNNIDLNINSKGLRCPIFFSTNVNTSHISNNVNITLHSEHDQHSAVLTNIINGNISIHSTDAYRSMFTVGVQKTNISVHSIGQVGASLIKMYDGNIDTDDLNINFTLDTPLMYAEGYPISIEYQGNEGKVIRNLFVKVKCINVSEINGIFGLRNLTSSGNSDSIAKGHTFENINISVESEDIDPVNYILRFPSYLSPTAFFEGDTVGTVNIVDSNIKYASTFFFNAHPDNTLNFINCNIPESTILSLVENNVYIKKTKFKSLSNLSQSKNFIEDSVSSEILDRNTVKFVNHSFNNYSLNRNGGDSFVNRIEKYLSGDLTVPNEIFRIQGTTRCLVEINYYAVQDYVNTNANYSFGRIRFILFGAPSGVIAIRNIVKDIGQGDNVIEITPSVEQQGTEGIVKIVSDKYNLNNSVMTLEIKTINFKTSDSFYTLIK